MKSLLYAGVVILLALLTACNTTYEYGPDTVAVMASYTDYINATEATPSEGKGEEPPEAPEETGITGKLTHLVYGDTSVYLFGSMHVGAPDWFPLHPAVYRAMGEASLFAFEYDLSIDPVVIASMMVQHMRTDPALGNSGELPIFVRYTQAMIQAFEAVGLSQSYSLDQYVLAQAQARNAQVTGLIPIEQELAMVMPQPAEVVAWLGEHFPLVEELLEEAQATKELYASQDFDGLAQLIAPSVVGENVLEQWLATQVLAKRSELFVEGIVALVQDKNQNKNPQGDTVFVTLGIGHLLGEANVIDALVQRGFAVQ